MATIRPFKAVRPVPEKAADVAALPYDVYNREEAAAAVYGKYPARCGKPRQPSRRWR